MCRVWFQTLWESGRALTAVKCLCQVSHSKPPQYPCRNVTSVFHDTFARSAQRSICNLIETWKGIDADISQVHDGPLFHC